MRSPGVDYQPTEDEDPEVLKTKPENHGSRTQKNKIKRIKALPSLKNCIEVQILLSDKLIIPLFLSPPSLSVSLALPIPTTYLVLVGCKSSDGNDKSYTLTCGRGCST